MTKSPRVHPALLLLALLPFGVAAGEAPLALGQAPEQRLCTGEYADDFAVLSERVREFERQPQNQYTYCVRNTALYECVSYGSDGNLRKVRRKAVSHGTAFAYKQQNGETLLLTNHHVAEYPAVTDDEHPVGDIPAGCKRVSESLKIVENERDAYDRDDVPLSDVVSDPAMDTAVLKAHGELPVMPWKVGRSAALRERNVVDVRGFPLGAFKATNVGKVISAHDRDDARDWEHDDFVIDALLSPGSSGSPVLAVSCTTGELELVGIYHAGYTGGSALNVVVGIDQIRDLMTTLKRPPRERSVESAPELDAQARARLIQSAPPAYTEPFFPFGNLTALVRPRADGAFVFEVLNRDFPLKPHPVLVLEDLPPLDVEDFGTLGRVWLGNRQGLRPYARSELDNEALGQISRILDALRKNALAAFSYRAAARASLRTREEFNRVARLERALRNLTTSHQDLSQNASELAERLAPHTLETPATLADALAVPPAPPSKPGVPSPSVVPVLTPAPAQTPPPREARNGTR